SLTLELDPAWETRALTWYLEQTTLALELQCVHGSLIDQAGTFFWGCTVLIPRLKLKAPQRGVNAEFDTVTFEGTVLDDGTNEPLSAWVYSAQPHYLWSLSDQIREDLVAYWPLNESSGTREDVIG